MKILRFAAASIVTLAVGCTEDVGACFDDGKRGLDTVVRGGHVEYAGQAIMNTACASCHGSNVEGAARRGAPAGLDFDLEPVDAADAEPDETASGRAYGVLASSDVEGLRSRQRTVFSERNLIWQQVKDGLMPPAGAFQSFWKLMTIGDSDEESPCTRGESLGDIDGKSSQDLLRNWLACRAPIVESYGGPVEVNGVPGKAGFQYLACESAPTEGITLEDLMNEETGLFATALCTACHPGSAQDYPLDLSSLDMAYATLVEDQTERCDGKPYVRPNEPDQSFLIDVLTKEDPGCDIRQMPLGGSTFSESQIEQIRAWISAGALRSP
jgi:hypothetical protein